MYRQSETDLAEERRLIRSVNHLLDQEHRRRQRQRVVRKFRRLKSSLATMIRSLLTR